jgi:aerobic carbon-monoxide dehydrogenase medium subunit
VKPAPFRCEAPASVEEAIFLLEKYGEEAKILAGGQSLGPLLNLRMSTPSVLIDLARVSSLRMDPRLQDGEVRVEAMTTYQELLESPICRERLPLLMQAVPFVGHQAIRNTGTIGGSVAHADPSAEAPAALVALGARIGIAGPDGERTVDAADFFTGVFTTSLETAELVAWIGCPDLGHNHGSAWVEVAPRHGDYAVVGVGAVIVADGQRITQARVCLTGVASVPYLAQAPSRLVGLQIEAANAEIASVARSVSAEADPRTDLVASAAYKRHLMEMLTAQALGRSLHHVITAVDAAGGRQTTDGTDGD